LKKINNFLLFLDDFDLIILKIIFKKYYFKIILNKNNFKKQLQHHS